MRERLGRRDRDLRAPALTHLGPLRTPKGEIAPTGKAFRVRMMASFEFAPGSAKIVCERPYFDRRAVVTALGLG